MYDSGLSGLRLFEDSCGPNEPCISTLAPHSKYDRSVCVAPALRLWLPAL